MNKVDFPIGVELPLRGGGVAVLYEFFENRWYGRMKAARNACRWVEMAWQPDGESGAFSPDDDSANYNILPPKRKAWVVWSQKMPRAWNTVPGHLFCTEAAARVRAEEIGGTVQEITEP